MLRSPTRGCLYRHELPRPAGILWTKPFGLDLTLTNTVWILLIAYVAATGALISTEASMLIQAATIITLVISSYIVVLNYPTPIAISDKLRRD